jgi:hypothetical protein
MKIKRKNYAKQRELYIYNRTQWNPKTGNLVDTVYDWFPEYLQYVDYQELMRLYANMNLALSKLERTLTVEQKVIVICKMFSMFLEQQNKHTDWEIRSFMEDEDALYLFWIYLQRRSTESFIKPIAEAEVNYL